MFRGKSMKTYFNWIVVKDKKQYLWLLALPLGLLKAILFDIHDSQMFNRLFETVMAVMVCVYFFIRFNSYSQFFNPDHPKPTDVK